MATVVREKAALLPDDGQVLAALQEKMDEIARGGAPNMGRFCGYCFARVGKDAATCGLCKRRLRDYPTTDRVPKDVLLVYNAHFRKMRLWVNLFAFTGIFLAVLPALIAFAFLPGFFKLASIPIMLGGSWYFANLLGGGLGGHLGMRTGAAARRQRWQLFQETRGLTAS